MKLPSKLNLNPFLCTSEQMRILDWRDNGCRPERWAGPAIGRRLRAYQQFARQCPDEAARRSLAQHHVLVYLESFMRWQAIPAITTPNAQWRDRLIQQRQVVGRDHSAIAQNRRALQHIAQLSNVARPSVRHQQLFLVLRQPGRCTADRLTDVLQECVDEDGNIGRPLAQRRQMDVEDAQAIVEVLAKCPARDGVAQIGVGRRDHANVRFQQARAAEQLRLVLAEVMVAAVRAQVTLSLFTDFENFTRFKPDSWRTQELHAMLDELVAWSKALKSVRWEASVKAASASMDSNAPEVKTKVTS